MNDDRVSFDKFSVNTVAEIEYEKDTTQENNKINYTINLEDYFYNAENRITVHNQKLNFDLTLAVEENLDEMATLLHKLKTKEERKNATKVVDTLVEHLVYLEKLKFEVYLKNTIDVDMDEEVEAEEWEFGTVIYEKEEVLYKKITDAIYSYLKIDDTQDIVDLEELLTMITFAKLSK